MCVVWFWFWFGFPHVCPPAGGVDPGNADVREDAIPYFERFIMISGSMHDGFHNMLCFSLLELYRWHATSIIQGITTLPNGKPYLRLALMRAQIKSPVICAQALYFVNSTGLNQLLTFRDRSNSSIWTTYNSYQRQIVNSRE